MVEESLVGFLEQSSKFLKLVFADRAAYMADSDFVPVPLAGLASIAATVATAI